MGAAYQRQDTTNNIANGNVINADDLDAEFDALQAAFAVTTGHSHDGTAGEGGPIAFVGTGQELSVTGNQVIPKVTNTVDLGTSSFKFRDGYIDRVLYADSITLLSGDLQDTLDNKQPLDAALTSISGLTSAADKMMYYTASDVLAITDLTSFGRSLIDDANSAAARTTLGLVIGTNVQAQDTSLQSLADLATTGFLSRGTPDVFTRTFQEGSGISIVNPAGVSGDPTFSVVGLATTNFSSATLITSGEILANNNNDTTMPTSAAVLAHVATNPWSFTSANQTITNGTTLTIAHGLAARPTEVFLVLRCTTADGNYAVGDEIQCVNFSDAGTHYGASATADATNIKIRTAAGGNRLMDDLGVSFGITNARWRYVVRAR